MKSQTTMSWKQWRAEIKAAAGMMVRSFIAPKTELPIPNAGPMEIGLVFTGFGAPSLFYNEAVQTYTREIGIPFIAAKGCNSWTGLNSVSLRNIASGLAADMIGVISPFRLPFKLPRYEVFWDSLKGLIEEIFTREIQGYEVAVVAAHSLGGSYAILATLFFPKIQVVAISSPRDSTTSPLLNRVALNSLGSPSNYNALATELCQEIILRGADKRIQCCGDDCLVPFSHGGIPACRVHAFHGLPWNYGHVNGINNSAVLNALELALAAYREDKQKTLPDGNKQAA